MRIRASIRLVVAALLLGAPASAAPPVEVALLPIAVHSKDPGSGYLSEGLASMLSSRLSQFESLRVVRVEGSPPPAGKLPDAALEAGRAAGAAFVVFGSFTQFGDGASLDLHCARVDGGEADARRVFVQAGALGDIIPKLDEVAGKIRAYVTGGASASAGGAAAAAPASGELERRVEALERAVYGGAQTVGPAAPPKPPPSPNDKNAPVR